jgi:hypothetical protein
MILYAMLPNMEHPTFQAYDFPDHCGTPIMEMLDRGPVWGYLTAWDMGRLQGMVDTGCLMRGSITLRADPVNQGMLLVAYGDFSLYGVFERKEHDANFLFTFSRGMVPIIHHLTGPQGIEWQIGKSSTMMVKFGADGHPVDLPCKYKEPRVSGPDNPTDVDTSPT